MRGKKQMGSARTMGAKSPDFALYTGNVASMVRVRAAHAKSGDFAPHRSPPSFAPIEGALPGIS